MACVIWTIIEQNAVRHRFLKQKNQNKNAWIKPENNNEIKHAVVLLHGYGGDGKDISSLTYNWKRFLPNTVFLCPDAHEKCSVNPSGFQWFDLNKDDPKYIVEQ